jgi:Tfp pilus assembly protein FimV
MTTIDLTATPALRVARAVPSTRLRLTRRGRRVVAALAATPAIIALGFAILSGGAALASGDAGADAGQFATVTVVPGDTLWSIASDIAPDVDPRDVINDIARLNALDSAELSVGASLAIPARYATGE